MIWVFDDFEDGDRVAAPGESWVPITDGLPEGPHARASRSPDAGAAGSRRALRIDGDVAAKGFAGAWAAIAAGGRAGDVSRLRRDPVARARPRRLLGRPARRPGTRTNFMAPFALRNEWGFVEIPFELLKPGAGATGVFEPANVRWFGVSPGSRVPFEIEIDEIALFRRPGSPPRRPPLSAARPRRRGSRTPTARCSRARLARDCDGSQGRRREAGPAGRDGDRAVATTTRTGGCGSVCSSPGRPRPKASGSTSHWTSTARRAMDPRGGATTRPSTSTGSSPRSSSTPAWTGRGPSASPMRGRSATPAT